VVPLAFLNISFDGHCEHVMMTNWMKITTYHTTWHGYHQEFTRN